MVKETVLFICSFNSVRSRIAEGLLAARGGGRYTVFSAGIAPAPLSPYTAAVMNEIGIDIPRRQPTPVTTLRTMQFDYVITLCDHVIRANIPLPSGRKTFHRGFSSPCEVRECKESILADFRKLRDRIDAWLTEIFPDCPPLERGAGSGGPGHRVPTSVQFRPMMRKGGDRV